MNDLLTIKSTSKISFNQTSQGILAINHYHWATNLSGEHGLTRVSMYISAKGTCIYTLTANFEGFWSIVVFL